MKAMTKRRIEQYGNLQREIIMLEGQILSAESDGEIVADYAKDYSTGYPKIITLRGYGSRAIPRLIERKTKLEAECDAVERYIEAVEDSVVRQLLVRKYIEGKTIGEAAQFVGYSDRQAKRIIQAFFEQMK